MPAQAARQLDQRAPASATPPGTWAMQAFCAPWSRSRWVTRRVSIPAIPGMPCRSSQPTEIEPVAPVRRAGHRGPGDHALDRRGQRLAILVVGADIADMREREGDDLPGIGRIGQDLLVAGHRGVEDQLAGDHGCAAEAAAGEDRSVLQGENAGGRGGTMLHRWANLRKK